MKYIVPVFLGAGLLLTAASVCSQPAAGPARVAGIAVNYDEAQVGVYRLPDPLLLADGRPVTDSATWMQQRRPEILQLLETNQFGRMPAALQPLRFAVREQNGKALGGRAIRRQVTLYLGPDSQDHKLELLIYLPLQPRPAPLLLHLSFVTNAMAVDDPALQPAMAWIKGQPQLQTSSNFSKINPAPFINRGIGFATLYYGDIEPDFKAGIRYGIRRQFYPPGQPRPADGGGAIAAWSWGLSRVMDYLQQDPAIDGRRIALQGASRLGKTVLWTGARDPRFSLIIPSISGEGGAALSRRNFGETIKMITDTNRYYYQFAPNYHYFADEVPNLPMDSHMLIALIAPRPVLIQSGDRDFFSDPRGAFLAVQAAEPVYRLFGLAGPGDGDMPAAGDRSLLHPLGYYLHAGGHTVLPEDYDVFIQFMQKQWGLR
ncbi:alpha/beta hydrolase family protein [Niabella terrae]